MFRYTSIGCCCPKGNFWASHPFSPDDTREIFLIKLSHELFHGYASLCHIPQLVSLVPGVRYFLRQMPGTLDLIHFLPQRHLFKCHAPAIVSFSRCLRLHSLKRKYGRHILGQLFYDPYLSQTKPPRADSVPYIFPCIYPVFARLQHI